MSEKGPCTSGLITVQLSNTFLQQCPHYGITFLWIVGVFVGVWVGMCFPLVLLLWSTFGVVTYHGRGKISIFFITVAVILVRS